jgi:hypothetical protein
LCGSKYTSISGLYAFPSSHILIGEPV